MYYYYVIKNWVISKYYSIFEGCVVNNIEYNEPLLNSDYDEEHIVKKNENVNNITGEVYNDEFKERLDDNNELNKIVL